ncbi:MAG: phospholipase D-like domain-containing protein, partial [Candidatus Thorarchaeota archaeon]|nr:phospholipase D-like domain-containing protein [Candidatus Thorarchaeota archaeon]
MQSNYNTILGLTVVFLMVLAAAPLAVTPLVIPYDSVSTPVVAETYEWQTFDKNMNVTTFASPDGSTEQLWKFLNSATESIYVEIYGINNPNILDLIHNLHDTKPGLDMKFLIGEGSLGYSAQNDYVANNLTELGYEVKWTSDSDFTYAHQKFVIIDNDTTIVHSGNWAKTSFPESNGKANREWSIAMTDTDVASYFRSVFDGDWTNGTLYDAVTDGTGTALTYTYSTSTYTRPFATAGEFSGQMKVTPIFSPDTGLQGILYCINAAQATLDIQVPYFTNADEGGSVNQIVDAILAAKARGVTVRVITEEQYDWELVEELFIEHDIPIVYQDTRWFTANHNKGIIVDGRIVLLSSINYSDGSIERNREAGVIIENDAIAQWYQAIYDFDFGIADNDATHEVTVYWDPNIPTSTSQINVTVYGHSLYSDIDEVELAVKIGGGVWTNTTITSNVYESAEGDEENYFHVIPAQADLTNITVVGKIRVGSTWHIGVPMVIRVRNSIASPTITSSTPKPTTTDDPIAAL